MSREYIPRRKPIPESKSIFEVNPEIVEAPFDKLIKKVEALEEEIDNIHLRILKIEEALKNLQVGEEKPSVDKKWPILTLPFLSGFMFAISAFHFYLGDPLLGIAALGPSLAGAVGAIGLWKK